MYYGDNSGVCNKFDALIPQMTTNKLISIIFCGQHHCVPMGYNTALYWQKSNSKDVTSHFI